MNRDCRIYVAGHQGLLGDALVRRLQSEGYCNLILRGKDRLNLIDQAAVAEFFEQNKPEYVFLAAAKMGGVYANSTFRADFIYENLMIEANVIHQAFLHEAKKLVFFSSADIYPRDQQTPITESQLLTGQLETTCEPYALAKLAGIKLCEAYNLQYGTDFYALVGPAMYGKNQKYDLLNSMVVPALIKRFHDAKHEGLDEVKIWGTGKAVRQFLSVDDMVDAALFLLQEDRDDYLYNVTSGAGVTIAELAESIKQVVGYPGRIDFDASRPDGVMFKALDSSRLAQLGWKPQVSLQTGLAQAYEAFQEELLNKDMRYANIHRVELSEKDRHAISQLEHVPSKAQPESYENRVVIKPWGYEFLVMENDCVAIWFLSINKGFSTSMHCHPQKQTSLILLSGKAMSSTFHHREYLKAGHAVIFDKGVFHSTKSLSEEGIFLLEVETPPNKTDLVRMKDRYGREKSGYEGTSLMVETGLEAYHFFTYHEQQSFGAKELRESLVSFETFANAQEFQTRFKVAEDELLTSCRGCILGPEGKVVLGVADTQRGDVFLGKELTTNGPLTLIRIAQR